MEETPSNIDNPIGACDSDLFSRSEFTTKVCNLKFPQQGTFVIDKLLLFCCLVF